MYDIRWIRANPDEFDRRLKGRKGVSRSASELLALDDARRAAILALETLQAERNARSREIGKAKAQKDEARAAALMAEVAAFKDRLPALEQAQRDAETALNGALAEIPNLPLESVPEGEDEHDNVPYYRPNESEDTRPKKPAFEFKPREHYELGEAMGDMDFEVAAKLSGSRFVVLKSDLARLSRAIGQFMLDLHVDEHGYTEVQPPLLVRDDALYGTGQLPKFEEDLFFAYAGRTIQNLYDAYWEQQTLSPSPVADLMVVAAERHALVPTAEVPLTNLVRETILAEDQLPLRFTALTPCFRSEAGSAGRDTRGMIRQHQFDKVEMVAITTPETSADEHDKMLADAEDVLKRLGLHYRVMTLSTGDMGFGAQKTWDIEVWLPGQDAYREISSVSVCGDFQARRMDARYRDATGTIRHVHTLNGSGVAVGRALIAVMENYQQDDGSIAIPPALVPYMRGKTTIGGRS